MIGSQYRQAIPTKLSLEQFEQFVLPHLSRGRRGPALTLALHTIFNYILQLLYTGYQWKALPIKMSAKGRPEIHYNSHLSGTATLAGRWLHRQNICRLGAQAPCGQTA